MDKFYKKTDAFFITNNQDLQFIFAKVRKLGEINKKVLALIEPSIARFCQVANMSGSKMIILAMNSSAATQLRFQTPDILKRLQKDPLLKHIKEIQIKMGMPEGQAKADGGKQNKPTLTAETGQMMRELADSLEDPKLKEIMRKIADRGSKV